MHIQTDHSTDAEPNCVGVRLATRGLGWPSWLLLIAASAIPIGLLLYRIRLTGTSGHMSLPWDIFLGWAPLIFVVPLRWVVNSAVWNRPRRMLVGLLLGMGWLLFFPNSPYLITELIHVNDRYGPSDNPAPTWARSSFAPGPYLKSPVWLELLLLTATAASGVLLTLASINLMHRLIARRLSNRVSIALIVGLLFLTSFGIGLGRFDRLNSWDVFTKPVDVAERIARRVVFPREHRGVTMCTLVLGSILSVGYFGMRAMAQSNEKQLGGIGR